MDIENFKSLKELSEKICYLSVNLSTEEVNIEEYEKQADVVRLSYEKQLKFDIEFQKDPEIAQLMLDTFGSIQLSCNLFREYLQHSTKKGKNDVYVLDKKSVCLFKCLYPFVIFILNPNIFWGWVIDFLFLLPKKDMINGFSKNLAIILQSYMNFIAIRGQLRRADIEPVVRRYARESESSDKDKVVFAQDKSSPIFKEMIQNIAEVMNYKIQFLNWKKLISS